MLGNLIKSDDERNLIIESYLDLMNKEKDKIASIEEITSKILEDYPDSKIDEEIVFDVLFEGSHECMRYNKVFFNSQIPLFNLDNSLGGGIDCGVPTERDRKSDK